MGTYYHAEGRIFMKLGNKQSILIVSLLASITTLAFPVRAAEAPRAGDDPPRAADRASDQVVADARAAQNLVDSRNALIAPAMPMAMAPAIQPVPPAAPAQPSAPATPTVAVRPAAPAAPVLPVPPTPPTGITVVDGDTVFRFLPGTQIVVRTTYTVTPGPGGTHAREYVINPLDLNMIKSRDGHTGAWNYDSTSNSPADWYSDISHIIALAEHAYQATGNSNVRKLWTAAVAKIAPTSSYTVSTADYSYKVERIGSELIRIEYRNRSGAIYPGITGHGTYSLILNTRTKTVGKAVSSPFTSSGWRNEENYRLMNPSQYARYRTIVTNMRAMTWRAGVDLGEDDPDGRDFLLMLDPLFDAALRRW